MTIRLSNIIKPVLAASVMLGTGLFLEWESRIWPPIEVKKGKLDSGIPYIVKTRPAYHEMEISLPGARIITYSTSEESSRLDQLQDNIITPDGKYISRDEVFYNRAILNDNAKDGNQSVRDHWKNRSVPNTVFRERIIQLGNQVVQKEGIDKVFSDGSPDYTTAQAREKAKLELSKGFR